MALLTNGAPSMQMTPQPGGSGQSRNEGMANYNSNDHVFLSNLFSALPRLDTLNEMGSLPVAAHQSNSSFAGNSSLDRGSISVPEDQTFSNAWGAIGSASAPNNEILGAIGTQLTPSASPQTSSSNGSPRCSFSLGALCGRCNGQAIYRCFDCNDVLCQECVQKHSKSSFSKDHCVVSILAILSVGNGNGANNINVGNEPFCDVHGETLRYICETCKSIVCQECTFWDHKDHACTPVVNIMHAAPQKILAILESGRMGTKHIKASIDRAVKYSQAVEKDAADAAGKIRRCMKYFISAAEDREKALLDRVEKCRLQRIQTLADQQVGLRSALAGLSSTSDMMCKTIDVAGSMNNIDLARFITTAESQIQQYASMFKNLQPREEFISFAPLNFDILQEIRTQGEVFLSLYPNCNNHTFSTVPNRYIQPPTGNVLTRRPIVRNIVPFREQQRHTLESCWDQMPSSKNDRSASPITTAPIPGMPVFSQAVPGCLGHVSARPSIGLSVTFGFDGHNDGQVSRPWGITADKDGNIIVADRRNNRVQVFYQNGAFKLKFGSKGTANGQFDLPAGICTDAHNRIIVVDKDNHRIQVFSPNGIFLLKFGTYGKDCGQFQYPWDVAVNIRGEIIVTDSRNHRIQLFSAEGQFISRFSFDGVHHNRYLKGLTTPRGVCFTPQGDIIVTDFENHRLLLVDASMTKIIAHKGHEGSAVHEFSRPSGICCDDDGRVIIADSKNQRVMIFSPLLDYMWAVDIRPSTSNPLAIPTDEKDRPSDVTLLPDGRLVVMVETSPDARDQCSPQKTFIQVY